MITNITKLKLHLNHIQVTYHEFATNFNWNVSGMNPVWRYGSQEREEYGELFTLIVADVFICFNVSPFQVFFLKSSLSSFRFSALISEYLSSCFHFECYNECKSFILIWSSSTSMIEASPEDSAQELAPWPTNTPCRSWLQSLQCATSWFSIVLER